MFDLFGIRRRRQERHEAALAAAAEKRRAYQERKTLIEDFLNSYDEKLRSDTYARYKKRCERDNYHNNTCPVCGSHNVIKHITRQKGEIHGSGSVHGSSSSSLFLSSGSIYGTSKIDGEMDTLPVNKCKDCGNEWNMHSTEYTDCESDNLFSVYRSRGPYYLYNAILDFVNMRYNPFDRTEECNSLEEKKTKYLKLIHKSYVYKDMLDFYRTVPRYMVEYALYKIVEHECHLGYSYAEDPDPVFEINDDDDEFSYRVSDELWNTIRYILDFDSKSV